MHDASSRTAPARRAALGPAVRGRQDRHDRELAATPGSSASPRSDGRRLGRLPGQAQADADRVRGGAGRPAAPTRRCIWHDFMVAADAIVDAAQRQATRGAEGPAPQADGRPRRRPPARAGHPDGRRPCPTAATGAPAAPQRRPAPAGGRRTGRAGPAAPAAGTGDGADAGHRHADAPTPPAAPAAGTAARRAAGGGASGGRAAAAPLRRRARGRAATAATRGRLPRAQKRHGSSTALVIPMRVPTSRARRPAGCARLDRGSARRAATVPLRSRLDAERLRELARAVAQVLVALDAAARAHQLDAVERLERADQHRGAHAHRLADGIEQRVDAVGAVDVGDAGRAEEGLGARRDADERVAGRLGVVVGLGLDDHAGWCRRGATTQPTGRGPPRAPGGRRTRAQGRSSRQRVQRRAARGELLAHPRQRGPALADLRLEPRAAREHRRRLLVERVGVLGELLGRELESVGRTRPPRAPARRRRRAPRGTARRACTSRSATSVAAISSSAAAAAIRSRRKRDAADHPARGGEAQLERVDRVEEVLLVLLHVLVVGQREAVHHPVQARSRWPTTRGALARSELGRVGVLLLRHDRRARAHASGSSTKPNSSTGPQHDLGAQARQVGRAGGRGAQEVQHEVAVGDRVDRVGRDARRSRARPPRRRGRWRS